MLDVRRISLTQDSNSSIFELLRNTTKRSYQPLEQAAGFQESMVGLVRALGLHRPDQTPCGQPVAVAEAHALLELTREPGLSQNGLAARLQLEKSTVSRVVTLLERRGWIERRRDTIDTRIVRVHVTRDGHEAAASLAASRRAKFAKIFEAIPKSERAAIISALAALTEVIRET